MPEIWKGAIDNNKAFGALPTDLSKAVDKSWFVDCQITCVQSWHRFTKYTTRLFK